MVNNLEGYKEVQKRYNDILDDIEKINQYALEIESVFDKIDEISGLDIFATDDLFSKLSDDLQVMFLRSHGEELQFGYHERYEEDLKMIKKYDPERVKKLKL